MMRLSEAARLLDGELKGRDAEFTAVTQDTRKLVPGALYVALKGARFDGHAFIAQALAAQAAGALVSEYQGGDLPQVRVRDTHAALGQLAAQWRNRFDVPVIGVTGSNGKTTVKNMLASIMGEIGPGLVTQGNLNNDIGVPLTLLRQRASDRYAVIEMGMNHLGEIDYLTRLARPTVALITNAAAAHLEGLGTVANVAKAKGEIFAGLAPDGAAIVNADDEYANYWRGLVGARRMVRFGLEHEAEVRARYRLQPDGSDIELLTPAGEIAMRLPLLGKHNVMNALAASAAALEAGATLTQVKSGLEKLKSTAGRLEIKRGHKGARVLDDTYNANPSSIAAGIEVLRGAGGRTVLVMGDMAELGESALDIHRRVGELARRVGIERLYALGPMSAAAVEAFGEGGLHFNDHAALAEALRGELAPQTTVLVKGSRVMQMERVVAAIAEESR